MVKRMQAGDDSAYGTMSKDLTDSFIMILNAGELLNLNLTALLKARFGVKRDYNSIVNLTTLIKSIESPNYAWTTETDRVNQVQGLLLDMADQSGVLDKACDSLDHMDGLQREQITNTIINLLIMLLLAGAQHNVSYDKTVPVRWKEIEDSKVL